jgi:LmbE family N-acetylglucosaminyl deacetylase
LDWLKELDPSFYQRSFEILGDLIREMKTHMYISPHLDDAVWSCGGVIYRQALYGDDVVVVTVCGGAPQEPDSSDYIEQLHKRWGTGPNVVEVRKDEDRAACAFLGARVIHFPIPDAIYRASELGEYYYPSDEAIFGEVHPLEAELVDELKQRLEVECAHASKIYAPAGYGGHVDHRLTRQAVDRLGMNHCLYRDFPYAFRGGQKPYTPDIPAGEEILVHLDQIEISRWAEAVKEYRSQLSTFWSDPHLVEDELQMFHDVLDGILLTYVKI